MDKVNYKSTLYACYLGYITQALIVNLPPILFIVFRETFGLSYAMLGSLVAIIFVTQLIVDALAIQFVDKIGHRASAVLAHAFAAFGMIALAILPRVLSQPLTGLVISCILFSIGGGLIEVLVSPIVDRLPSEAKASSMSLLHSFYSWGQALVIVLSTLALRFIGKDLWYILPLVWSLLPFFTLFQFVRAPFPPAQEESRRMPLKKLLTSRFFLLAMLLMVCSGAAEQTMGQWASIFVEKGLNISKTLGDLLGPCLFAVMMGVARTMYGVKGQKLNMHKTLMVSAFLCVLSFVLTALVPIPWLALVGCSLCGLSVSLMWPGTLSLTSEGHPCGGTAMFAILALGGDLGCSAGPWLTGIIADRSDLNVGLLAAIIFPIAMIVGLSLLRPRLKIKS